MAVALIQIEGKDGSGPTHDVGRCASYWEGVPPDVGFQDGLPNTPKD